jgi:hypothetical protein
MMGLLIRTNQQTIYELADVNTFRRLNHGKTAWTRNDMSLLVYALKFPRRSFLAHQFPVSVVKA